MKRFPHISRWLLAGIAVWLALGLAFVWSHGDAQRQDRHVRTVMVLLVAFVLFLIWVLFASKWKPRARWSVFIGTIFVVVICRFTLRIHGVTGDLLPIVEWRWKK